MRCLAVRKCNTLDSPTFQNPCRQVRTASTALAHARCLETLYARVSAGAAAPYTWETCRGPWRGTI
eukprot:1751056-Pleurochrysis_carterae.AAC.2